MGYLSQPTKAGCVKPRTQRKPHMRGGTRAEGKETRLFSWSTWPVSPDRDGSCDVCTWQERAANSQSHQHPVTLLPRYLQGKRWLCFSHKGHWAGTVGNWSCVLQISRPPNPLCICTKKHSGGPAMSPLQWQVVRTERQWWQGSHWVWRGYPHPQCAWHTHTCLHVRGYTKHHSPPISTPNNPVLISYMSSVSRFSKTILKITKNCFWGKLKSQKCIFAHFPSEHKAHT